MPGLVASARELAARFPWPETPLGDRSTWDPALTAVLELVLAAPVPMALVYGDDLLLLYNDASIPLLGAKHPAAFGAPAAEIFAEFWRQPGGGDVVERVYKSGEPALESEVVLPMRRRGPDGPVEQAFFMRGYSAVRDSRGRIIGVLSITAETTATTRRLQRFGELTAALSRAATLDDVARVTLRWALTALELDHAAFIIDDGGGWRGTRRIPDDVLDEADERMPPLWQFFPPGARLPAIVAVESGEPLFLTGQPLDEYRTAAVDRHDLQLMALAAVPLRTSSLRGAVAFGSRDAHSWPPAERALLSAVAELVAQAAERARLFETQHGTARLLQRSLLPQTLPSIEQFRVAARYETGVDGNAAGGDFYDAFTLPDGRLAVVLGDVAGHDVRAAALMGQVRAALRALAFTDPEPAVVLTGLDRLVANLAVDARDPELFVTVTYGLADHTARTLAIASAGHPPPLLRRHPSSSDSPVTSYLDIPPGPPLGVGGGQAAVTVDLVPGDTVLLYSDGVIERRHADLTDGLAALLDVVGEATSGDPRNLCALVARAVPGTTEDDVAVLAFEYATTPGRSAIFDVPPEPTSPARIRRWLLGRLAAWRIAEETAETAALCASELATNALLHAGTPSRVRVDVSAERLLVAVTDGGTRGRVQVGEPEPLSRRGRGLQLVEHLADAWGSDQTIHGTTVWFELLLE